MRRFSFLIFSLLALFFLGCGRDTYTVEKEYWQAHKKAERIFKNPSATPPLQLQKTIERLKKFIQNNPREKLAIEADFDIARLYIVKREYSQATGQLNGILEKYKDKPSVCAEAIFLLGNTEELQDNWDKALLEYRKILEKYPTTLRGLDVPVYIANHYKVTHQPDKMIAAFQEAAAHYQSQAAQAKDTGFAYTLDSLSVQCFVAIKDWKSALNHLDFILEKYQGKKINLDAALLQKIIIYSQELKNDAAAKQAFEQLKTRYPKSKFIDIAADLFKSEGKK